MNRLKGSLFLCAAMLFLATATAAQGENEWVGRWKGSDGNATSVAVATVTITEPIPQSGVLALKGTVAIGEKEQEGPPSTFRLRGEQIGDQASGTLRGEDRRIDFTGGPARPVYKITFRSGTFGKFEISLRRVSDISGVWLFPDGNPMTIKKQNGDYVGTYRGTAASGHADLRGVLRGDFTRQIGGGEWEGTFTINELAVVVTGTFTMEYDPPFAGSPATLSGTLTSSTGTNPITLEKSSG